MNRLCVCSAGIVCSVREGCRASEAGLSVRHYLITGIDKSRETAGDAFFTWLSFHGRVQSPEVQQLYFSNSMYTSNIQRAAQNLFVGLSVSGWLKAPDLMRAQRALGVSGWRPRRHLVSLIKSMLFISITLISSTRSSYSHSGLGLVGKHAATIAITEQNRHE